MTGKRPSQHRSEANAFSPDDVAGTLGRNDGGFGRGQQSYYDLPVLHATHWKWEIVTYFWLGGIMSGSALLTAVADTAGSDEDAPLVRNGRYVALVSAAVSAALLTKDLGRPQRFFHMLRILKFGSPMSVGTWALVWFSLSAASVAAAQLARDGVLPLDLAGIVPLWLRNGSLALAALVMAFYTGVLISATAIPVWYSGRRYIPALFVASAAATACSLNVALLALRGGSPKTIAKLERMETLAAALEIVLLEAYRREAGTAGKAFFTDAVGTRMRLWTQLLGLAVPLTLNIPAWFGPGREREGANAPRRLPLVSLAASALTLYGGFVLRESFVLAGRRSAADPKPVLETPQPSTRR